MLEIIREYHHVGNEQRELRDKGYAAITYTDHYTGEPDVEGRKVNGTEDFTLERYQAQIVRRVVYMPTGALNKGGKKIWGCIGTVRARNARDCGKIARLVFAGKEISVRKY